MFRMSASGKLAESAQAFVFEYLDETYLRGVKPFHGHLLQKAIEFVARMSSPRVLFRKTHFFEQHLFFASRDLVKRPLVFLAAQTIKQLQAIGPLVLQSGVVFACRRHQEVDITRNLGLFCSRALVGRND